MYLLREERQFVEKADICKKIPKNEESEHNLKKYT